MKRLIIGLVLAAGITRTNTPSEMISKDFSNARIQYQAMLGSNSDLSRFPKTLKHDGTTSYTDIKDWTGGFWPGCLWQVYRYTHETQWKDAAIKWTESLERNQYNTDNHDVGFMMNCSYGNALKMTGDRRYETVLIQSAKSLLTRFDPKVGAIRSWNYFKSWDGKSTYQFPVIIDNMMNLELLFEASKLSGDAVFRQAAVRHAETTMKNHFRSDFSTYHVVCYDPQNGKVLSKETAQGFADNSSWSRGQAWGLYGFTMVYRETRDKKFLKQAIGIADYYLDSGKAWDDHIPYWDMNVDQSGFYPKWNYIKGKFKEQPKDASAAAIVSSALLELSGYVPSVKGRQYFRAAEQIIASLSVDKYLAEAGTNGNFLLKHSVGSMPHGAEIDVPLIYADYYFLEALNRYHDILEHNGKLRQ